MQAESRAPGQMLLVHPGHVGMFEGSVQFQITRVPGVANLFFGQDGFHLVALTAPVRPPARPAASSAASWAADQAASR